MTEGRGQSTEFGLRQAQTRQRRKRKKVGSWEGEKVGGLEEHGAKSIGHRVEGRGQRTEGRGQMTEDRGQMTEGRGQRAEDRCYRAEDRCYRAED
jgi:hypothetical protein